MLMRNLILRFAVFKEIRKLFYHKNFYPVASGSTVLVNRKN